MPRIFRLVIALILFFSIFVVIARAIGVVKLTYIDELFLAAQTNSDGSPCTRPCMFGVQIGVTKYDESLEMLKSHPFIHVVSVKTIDTYSEYPSLEVQLPENILLRIDGNKNELFVTDVVLYIGKTIPSPVVIGDIIAGFGFPDSVGRYVNYSMKTFSTILDYPSNMEVYCDIPLERNIKPNTPAKAVSISLYPFRDRPSSWRGFVKYRIVPIGL